MLFIIAATRINAVFLLIFIGAGLGFVLLASALWATAELSMAAAGHLMVVSSMVLLHIHCRFKQN